MTRPTGRKPPTIARSAPRPERQVAFALGLSAESRAAAFLIAKGYRIVARRWKSPVGEIDQSATRTVAKAPRMSARSLRHSP